jgi:hypothetical protein
MKIEYWISGLALLVSIIFGIISWKTFNKANDLQEKVLNLTTQAKEYEIRKGEIVLMSLLGRYSIIQINCWELDGKMRTTEIDVDQYINELRQLNEGVDDLVTNPFYIEVLEKYPEINLLWIALRRVIIERERDKKMEINPQLFEKFYDLYFKIRNRISDRDMFKNQFYVSTDEASNFLKKEIQKLQANK